LARRGLEAGLPGSDGDAPAPRNDPEPAPAEKLSGLSETSSPGEVLAVLASWQRRLDHLGADLAAAHLEAAICALRDSPATPGVPAPGTAGPRWGRKDPALPEAL